MSLTPIVVLAKSDLIDNMKVVIYHVIPVWALIVLPLGCVFRCPRDHGTHFLQKPSCQSLGFHGQSTALIVVKPKPTWAELLAQNPVLLAQVIDDLVFPLVHPSGHSDQYETKRIQYSQHSRLLMIASLALAPNYRQFKQFQFSVHTGIRC